MSEQNPGGEATTDPIDAAFDQLGITDEAFASDVTDPEPAPQEAEPAPAEQAAPEAEAAPQAEGEQPGPTRDEQGRFAKKDEAPAAPEAGKAPDVQAQPKPEAPAAPAVDVPPRFSDSAKAEWEKVPAPVKHEVRRALGEMEQGLAQYQADFGELRGYAQQARQNGTTIKAVCDEYLASISALNQNPVQAIENIARQYGVDVRSAWAQQQGQQGQPQAEPLPPQVQQIMQQNAALVREVQSLRQGLGGVQQYTQAQQTQNQINDQVAQFRAANPRFDELRSQISQIIRETGADLPTAYRYAEQLNPQAAPPPVPAPAPQAAAPQVPPAAQTRENLSISGAAGSGSNPRQSAPPADIDAHLDRIFDQVGI